MKSRRLSFFLAIAALAILFFSPIPFQVDACGPFFEPEVFVRTNLPDDRVAFSKGQLGILQPKYDSNEYAVAFRYLNGGTLSSAERDAYLPSTASDSGPRFQQMNPAEQTYMAQNERDRMDQQPAGHWLLERARFAPAIPPEAQKISYPTNYADTIVFDENYINCPDGAFTNAVLTLHNRASAWGEHSPALLDWIHAQDTVFSNCSGKNISIPAAAPSDSPLLLRADRSYQIASATFYAKQFDDAAKQFAAIAADSASPWHIWGAYLAARATVRKAFAMGKATNPYSGDQATFDIDTMQQAQRMLETLLRQKNPTPSRAIILDELNFIRIRTEPEKRAIEISEALAGPAPDPNFHNDLNDLGWILERQVNVENPPALLAWIAAWRGSGTSASVYAAWQQTHALPWLVMALFKAAPADPFTPELIDDAARIAPGSPAYATVFFHRVRLLIGIKRADEARTLLDAELALPRAQQPGSYRNALLGERMQAARNFSEFLTFAPRNVLEKGSSGVEDLQEQCNAGAKVQNGNAPCPELNAMQFDEDAASVLNRLTPLTMLADAARSPALPQNLRTAIAIEAWTRSVILDDAASAAKLAPLLPKQIRDTAGNGVGFAADLAILRNPGIRPYLEPGVPRVASFSTLDDFRNNWWCKPWEEMSDQDPSKPLPLVVPAFVDPGQKALADAEYDRLQQLPDSVIVIGQRVVDYARDHPEDPLVPEALALTVRAGHYACASAGVISPDSHGSEYTPVGKAAFELLHHSYPKSSWAQKTKYYY